MSGKKKRYVLTKSAEQDFRQARHWSISRWSKDLTKQYFNDLHRGAEYIALNHMSLPEKDHLTGISELGIHAVREHYIVYVPIGKQYIAIVALIRQSRDVPAIIKANNYLIRRELKEILDQMSKRNNA